MRAEEVTCLAILPNDVKVGMEYACKSLSFTFDRMRYGDDLLRRISKIALGKTCEATLSRFLRQHAIPHLSREGATPHTQTDRFDFRIMNEIVDLKTFRISDSNATPTKLLEGLALVPAHHKNDQWRNRKKYQRYLFGFFKGVLKLRWMSEQENKHSQTENLFFFGKKAFVVLSSPSVLFLTAAPEISECEMRFRAIPAGTRCLQYPGGTRIRNMGCEIEKLTSFKEFLNKIEHYMRR